MPRLLCVADLQAARRHHRRQRVGARNGVREGRQEERGGAYEDRERQGACRRFWLIRGSFGYFSVVPSCFSIALVLLVGAFFLLEVWRYVYFQTFEGWAFLIFVVFGVDLLV